MTTATSSTMRFWYLSLLYGGLTAVLLGNLFRRWRGDEFPTFTFLYPGAIACLAGVVCGCILLYRSWRCVARHAPQFDATLKPLDPAGAVVLTVFPLLNLIGMFFSLGRLPRELNRLAIAARAEARAPEDLGTATALVAITAVIPIVGVLSAIIVGLVLFPRLMVSCSRVADAIEIVTAGQTC